MLATLGFFFTNDLFGGELEDDEEQFEVPVSPCWAWVGFDPV